MSDYGKAGQDRGDVRDYQKDFADVEDIDPRGDETPAGRQGVFVDVREAKEQKVSMLPAAITEAQLCAAQKIRDRILIGYCTSATAAANWPKLKAKGLSMLNLARGAGLVHDGAKSMTNGETRRIHVYGRKWDLGPKDYEASGDYFFGPTRTDTGWCKHF